MKIIHTKQLIAICKGYLVLIYSVALLTGYSRSRAGDVNNRIPELTGEFASLIITHTPAADGALCVQNARFTNDNAYLNSLKATG